MKYNQEITIGPAVLSLQNPTYFIADIAANHDGDLQRAKELIFLAKEAGADAVKFQHFLAEKIVSDYGFRNLQSHQSHQAAWKKSVFEIYDEYHCRRDWTETLVKTAKDCDIEFMTTPYDLEILDSIDPYVRSYKIGSGDVTWLELIEAVAQRNKPVLLATGAATMGDVERAVGSVLNHNPQLVLMQCNTNYTAAVENFGYINLRVLQRYAERWPGMVLGLSDHTPGHATVLGAITLGARVVEKHFTDDVTRTGPDHKFSMTPQTWREMVDRSRELQTALGDGVKRIEGNEQATVVVQRRAMRFKIDAHKGQVITADMLEPLRPADHGAVLPYEVAGVVGKTLNVDKPQGDSLYHRDLQ